MSENTDNTLDMMSKIEASLFRISELNKKKMSSEDRLLNDLIEKILSKVSGTEIENKIKNVEDVVKKFGRIKSFFQKKIVKRIGIGAIALGSISSGVIVEDIFNFFKTGDPSFFTIIQPSLNENTSEEISVNSADVSAEFNSEEI